MILNKAGGLIYQRDFNEGLKKLSSNDYLVLAGTFHGVHAITSRVSPVPGSGGLEIMESEHFRMQCFQTLTGIPHPIPTVRGEYAETHLILAQARNSSYSHSPTSQTST